MQHPYLRRAARRLPSALFALSLLASAQTEAWAQHEQHGAPPNRQTRPAATPTPTPVTTPAPTPAPAADHGGHAAASQQPGRAEEPAGPTLTLAELEALAIRHNPTLAQAEAAVRAAEGRRRQAGLFPNPVVGYEGAELAFRAPGEISEHGVFVEQTIPLGGKLSKAKRVFEREREQAEALAEAQRLRVLNSVRLLYFEALGAQRLVALRADLARLAREAVGITAELYNVGQADRPDQLEIEIEAERAEIESLRARNELEEVWRALAASVGRPDLPQARLAGRLEEGAAAFDEAQALTTLLSESPEVKSARAGVERARAALARARAGRVPDLFVRGGLGYSNERLEGDGRRVGPEANVEVGVTLPLFDRNQGGVAAAEAELTIAERELERLRLQLQTRLASSLRQYRNAAQTVERYRTRVVPRARQAYEMYLGNFRRMAASYPQVLIAQRTLFQVEAEYARALVSLRRTAVGLRGFLLTGGLDAPARPGEAREAGGEVMSGGVSEGGLDDR